MSKVAVVTGGNRGIGYCIAKQLIQQFDGTVIVTARDDNQGKEACTNLCKDGGRVEYHKLDITSKDSINSLANHVKDTFGGLDVLINNAGIMIMSSSGKSYAEKADLCVRTNFFGTLDVFNSLYPLLREEARVVNVSSEMGSLKIIDSSLALRFISPKLTVEECIRLMGKYVWVVKQGKARENGWPDETSGVHNPAYSVSKLGVTALTAVLARQAKHDGPQGILINAACPGWCRTEMGGSDAPRSADEGARTPVYLALLPPCTTSPNGQTVSSEHATPWKQGN